MEGQHAIQPYDVSTSGPASGEPSLASQALGHAKDLRVGAQALTTNVNALERLASGLVGGLLLARGVGAAGPLNKLLALVGSALVYRGVSGHCHLYQTLGVDTAHRPS